MSHIIHSRNLFIDTTSGSGKGDEFNLELGANMLRAQDGQFMRLTLVNFNMYNNLYSVNSTNNQFRVVSRYGANGTVSQFLGISTLHSIPSKNYKSCGDIALAFAQAVHGSGTGKINSFGSASITHIMTNHLAGGPPAKLSRMSSIEERHV